MDLFNLGIQKYWSMPSSTSKEVRQMKLEHMSESGQYLWAEKFDGNFLRGIITKDKAALQTRGISVKTNTFGEVQDKVFFWDSVVSAFTGNTILLGEGYLPGGIDKEVGSILRSLPQRALNLQKNKKLEWRIFDVLMYNGLDLLNSPIEERIKYIEPAVQQINNPLVKAVSYHEMTPDFFTEINDIFARGGEGAILFKKGIKYSPGRRSSAWTTVKVKQEISNDIDCFITGIEPPTEEYSGKEIGSWPYWKNTRTGEKLLGQYFEEYQLGGPFIPVSKNYYYDWPGAIYVGVYKGNGEIYQLCKVAGLTEEIKTELRDNFNEWYLCPLTIGGMMVSNTGDGAISIRHPYIKAIRKDDIPPEDCTLKKILD